MRKLFPEQVASFGTIMILTLIVVFHLLVITGIIPFSIVWGGRLQNKAQMLQFEAVSIGLNVVMITVVALKAGYLKVNVSPVVLRIILGIMTGLFILNTVGNMLSKNDLEKMIFTPTTLLLAMLCFRLTLGKKQVLKSQPASN